jgi:hypothetical protein
LRDPQGFFGKQSGTPILGGYPEWNKERSGENEFAP